MEMSSNVSDSGLYADSSSSTNSSTNGGGGFFENDNSSRREGFRLVQFPGINFFQSPLSFVLDYSGILRSESGHRDSESSVSVSRAELDSGSLSQSSSDSDAGTTGSINSGDVSIRILVSEESDEGSTQSPSLGSDREDGLDKNGESVEPRGRMQVVDDRLSGRGEVSSESEQVRLVPLSLSATRSGSLHESDNTDSSYQTYDIQQVSRWIEQLLPFSLLLVVVFIRQHLQGFFVTIWISAILFKSNDIVRKQTALKGERKVSVLVAISMAFMLHVFGVYWWFQNDDLLYPLFMLSPKEIPPFWHAIFIILVNDTLMGQAAMAFKCLLLIYYKNGRGHNFCRQGQMLTLLEYTLLLYRALLPTPVWYRFFLNKDYGSLFSSLMTGLYLAFKLTSVVEKVQCIFAAIRALSRKEVQYGSYATLEQVNAAGDLCAICQDKMQGPILLRCKHNFCVDCVAEWFQRERTCLLCRAVVKPTDLRTFEDGSTSLFFQLF